MIAKGFLRNHYLDGAIPAKSTSPIPTDNGSVPESAGGRGMVVFIIGASSSQ